MAEPLAAPMPQVAPALAERPAAPPFPVDEAPLLQEEGLMMTTQRLVVRGRTWPLAELLRVETARQSPRVWPLVAVMGLCVGGGLPVLSALSVSGSAARGTYEAALIGLALTLFGVMARLLLMEDTYCLLLHTSLGRWRILSGRQPERLIRLAGIIHEAANTARRGR